MRMLVRDSLFFIHFYELMYESLNERLSVKSTGW